MGTVTIEEVVIVVVAVETGVGIEKQLQADEIWELGRLETQGQGGEPCWRGIIASVSLVAVGSCVIVGATSLLATL